MQTRKIFVLLTQLPDPAAKLLRRTKAARLKKHSTLYLPQDLRKLEELRLVFQGDMQLLSKRYIALPEGTA